MLVFIKTTTPLNPRRRSLKLGCTNWGLILAVYALSGCGGMGVVMVGPIVVSALLGGGIPSGSMPDHYHGQAEKEIKSGKYDPKLWAEALVLVEGDETRRYAKYIDLRAAQLEYENEGPESESSLTEPLVFSTNISGTNIPGIYVSDIQGGAQAVFRDRNPRFTFEQSGWDIIGTDVSKNGSKIIGIRKGNTIKFKYWGRYRLITGKWKINPDGNSLEGTWEGSGHGSWNLARIELRANQLYSENVSSISKSNLNEQPVPGTDISGTYVSDIQGDPPWMFRDRKPMFTFEQSGNDIIGTDVSKNSSKVIGIRNGDTIKFKYQGAHRLILGKWKINPDGTSLEGTWETDTEHGSWNLTRIE
jgi:hypothetical protein